ncbi:hypothetical protein RRG08_051648 [Elysia crispata]|uniref:Uncharacterized protein n=1 Tax=Elysia crispata TaxID=231223 RepID=A0AAE1A2V2_9GAST|nr:hypothetical protein RRG08_051648 [Elysia crispata]
MSQLLRLACVSSKRFQRFKKLQLHGTREGKLQTLALENGRVRVARGAKQHLRQKGNPALPPPSPLLTPSIARRGAPGSRLTSVRWEKLQGRTTLCHPLQ